MVALLDTDHISILQYSSPSATTLERRLAALPSEAVAVSIVSFQEQTRGWLAYLHRARKREQVLKGFADLQKLLWY